jgi:hypothetical protein
MRGSASAAKANCGVSPRPAPRLTLAADALLRTVFGAEIISRPARCLALARIVSSRAPSWVQAPSHHVAVRIQSPISMSELPDRGQQ